MYLSLKADTSGNIITQTACEGVSTRGTFFVCLRETGTTRKWDWVPPRWGCRGENGPLTEEAPGGSGAKLRGRAQRALKHMIDLAAGIYKRMKHLKPYSLFEAQMVTESEYRTMDKSYVMDNFKGVPNNTELYDAKESDFSDLPWFQALKAAFPTFHLDRVRKIRKMPSEEGYMWHFSVEVPRGVKTPLNLVYKVFRPSDKSGFSNGLSQIYMEDAPLTHPAEFKVYLNDKESWNQIFKVIYFSAFVGSSHQSARSISHIMDLFSTDLEALDKKGDLGIVGVKKDCNPYGGHYKSSVNMLKNLPYGIFDDIKKGFIKGIEEKPGEMQYAISQCQLPNSSAEKGFGTARLYPENEVLDFYNLMKEEGYVPPAGFDEETEEISGLHKSLGDIGL